MNVMANPNPSPETRFKPGESGNPKGKSPEQRMAEMQAAEKAAIFRRDMLFRMQERVDGGEDILDLLDANTLKLFKDSEDRAHGTPAATTTLQGDPDKPLQVTKITRTIVDP